MFSLLFSLLGVAICAKASPVLQPREGKTSAFNASVTRWEWKATPGYLHGQDQGRYLDNNGVKTWYTSYGCEDSMLTPVLFLHGGTGNANQMYNQANKMAKTRKVILQDFRGQGRSPYEGFTDYHYDDLASDALALIDHLNISKVAVVGWSDGAITGLNLAMNYIDRIDRVFAHGANPQWNTSQPGLKDPIINSDDGTLASTHKDNGTTSSVNGLGLGRRDDIVGSPGAPYDCDHLSPLPGKCADMKKAVAVMWGSEPSWGPEAFAKIQCPVWVVDGDHDRSVPRNQVDAITAWTPYAGQLILPQVGHPALLQDPKFFTFAVEYFLDQEFCGPLPVY